jgi:hypothetical protein
VNFAAIRVQNHLEIYRKTIGPFAGRVSLHTLLIPDGQASGGSDVPATVMNKHPIRGDYHWGGVLTKAGRLRPIEAWWRIVISVRCAMAHRVAPLCAGPESILPVVVMDTGLAQERVQRCAIAHL